jgi:hypothetical protein
VTGNTGRHCHDGGEAFPCRAALPIAVFVGLDLVKVGVPANCPVFPWAGGVVHAPDDRRAASCAKHHLLADCRQAALVAPRLHLESPATSVYRSACGRTIPSVSPRLRRSACSAGPLWQFYIQLVEVEAAFKNLKDDLRLRPIYHQREGRIEAHIFVAFLAYSLHVTLRSRLIPLSPGLTPRAVLAARRRRAPHRRHHATARREPDLRCRNSLEQFQPAARLPTPRRRTSVRTATKFARYSINLPRVGVSAIQGRVRMVAFEAVPRTVIFFCRPCSIVRQAAASTTICPPCVGAR